MTLQQRSRPAASTNGAQTPVPSPDGPPPPARGPCTYLHHLARCPRPDDAEWARLHEEWASGFYAIYYEQYAEQVPAAVAEVTATRPPYDYRSQRPGPLERLRRRRAGAAHEPDWAEFREALVVWPPSPEFQDLNDVLLDLSDLYLRASNYTDQEDATFCHRLLRPALAECVSAYDAWRPAEELAANQVLVDRLKGRLQEIQATYARCATRRTVTHYAFGMLLGLLILLPAFIAANAVSFRVFRLIDGVALPAALVGSVHAGIALGAVGAASSVLLRISSSKVDLDVESTRHGWYPWADPVIQRGMFRVAMGSIFGGMAAWFLHAGVLLPDALQGSLESASSAVVVAGAVAYVAGFSERFIPDLIMRTTTSQQ